MCETLFLFPISRKEFGMSNRYRFGVHQGLTPPELFFLVVLEETAKETGVEDLASLSMILLGRPLIPTRGKFAGAVKGTSVASVVSRRLLPFEIKHKILPTFTSLKSLFLLRIKFTRNMGAFVGRAIPGVGWVLLSSDVAIILFRSAVAYNHLVQPEDRL